MEAATSHAHGKYQGGRNVLDVLTRPSLLLRAQLVFDRAQAHPLMSSYHTRSFQPVHLLVLSLQSTRSRTARGQRNMRSCRRIYMIRLRQNAKPKNLYCLHFSFPPSCDVCTAQAQVRSTEIDSETRSACQQRETRTRPLFVLTV